MSFGVLIPPTFEMGPLVTDADHLREIEAAGGNPDEITALAQRLGALHDFPDADHFYVPYDARPWSTKAARDERGLIVAYLAAWRNER